MLVGLDRAPLCWLGIILVFGYNWLWIRYGSDSGTVFGLLTYRLALLGALYNDVSKIVSLSVQTVANCAAVTNFVLTTAPSSLLSKDRVQPPPWMSLASSSFCSQSNPDNCATLATGSRKAAEDAGNDKDGLAWLESNIFPA